MMTEMTEKENKIVCPTYTFINKKTKNEWNEFLSISECDKFLEDNPEVEIVISARAFISGINNKPDEGFREILRTIKKANPTGKCETFD